MRTCLARLQRCVLFYASYSSSEEVAERLSNEEKKEEGKEDVNSNNN
jgi:hypothetical protein